MKINRYLLKLVITIFMLNFIYTQNNTHQQNVMKINMIVDAACGKCQFSETSLESCIIGVSINSEYYYIDELEIGDFMHGSNSDFFCKGIKKVHITGEIKNDEFYLQSFKIKHFRRMAKTSR